MRITLSKLIIPIFALAGGHVKAALDFTLKHEAMSADAIALSKPYITDGSSKIYLQFPGNWQVVDNADGLEFTPDVSSARIYLGRYKGPNLSIDEAGARTLLQQLSVNLPKGATKVVVQPFEYNPLPLFGWTNLRVSLKYEFFGQSLRQSLMFIRMTPSRLTLLSVTAPDADFDKLNRPARALIGSWFEPSRDLPPDLARKYTEEDALK